MNEEAREIERFLESGHGKKICEHKTLSIPDDLKEYLLNRIRSAFVEGMSAGKAIQLAADREKVADAL